MKENNIAKFGKIIHQFDIPRVEWEIDSKGWICDGEDGKRVIVLSNHNELYVASHEELIAELDSLSDASKDINRALMLYTTGLLK